MQIDLMLRKINVSETLSDNFKGVRRPGKTKRDRENQCAQRNASNKAERAEWQNDSKATNLAGSFPYGTCNGKRNRALKARRYK